MHTSKVVVVSVFASFLLVACGAEEIPAPGSSADQGSGSMGSGSGSGGSGGSAPTNMMTGTGGAGRGGAGGSTSTGGSSGTAGSSGRDGGAPTADAGSGSSRDSAGSSTDGSGGTTPKPDPGPLPEPGATGLVPQNKLTDPAAALFDDSKVHTVEITLDSANAQKLEQTAGMEMWVQGEVTIDGMKVAPVGVRYKGNYTLTYCVRNRCRKSYKIDFAEFNKDNRLLGLKRLNLHVMFNDETYLRDSLSYAVQRDFGVPAPRTAHAKVTVNGKAMGLYVMVEAIDGQFARTRFADGKGNVYKEEWPSSTSTTAWTKALRTNRDDMPSVDRAVRFATELKAAGDANFEQVLSKWMDVDTLVKVIALDRAIQNWDGPIDAWWCFGGKCKNHNFYWYEESKRDRLWLLLWDMNDTWKPFLFKQIHQREGLPDFPESGMPKPCTQEIRVLGGGTPAKPSYCDDFLRRIGTVLKPKIVAAQKMLLETQFTREALQARVDRWVKVLEPVVTELEKTQGIQQPTFQLAKWKNDVRNLREGFIPEMVNDLRTRASR